MEESHVEVETGGELETDEFLEELLNAGHWVGMANNRLVKLAEVANDSDVAVFLGYAEGGCGPF